jgi:hypothetical protein
LVLGFGGRDVEGIEGMVSYPENDRFQKKDSSPKTTDNAIGFLVLSV